MPPKTITDYATNAYIKDIYLELPDYQYNHRSLSNENEEIFIGREELIKDFTNVLEKSKAKGAYLVTGYRGMGKTSFVKKVVKEYKGNKKNTVDLHFSLAQNNLKETDLLKQITKSILDEIEKACFIKLSKWFSTKNVLLFLVPILSLIISMYLFFDETQVGTFLNELLTKFRNSQPITLKQELKPEGTGGFFMYSVFAIISISLIIGLFLNNFFHFLRFFPFFNSINKLHDQVSNLYNRCCAEISTEDSLSSTTANLPFGFLKRDAKKYNIASAKEIEYELIDVLKKYKKEFIFIFDELDKIDLGKTGDFFQDTKNASNGISGGINDSRERKQLIMSLLSSMKHFMTEAEACFIFIAGREMFDASLADIADRQSSLSSIFHKTFYVDSFLKDSSHSNHNQLTTLFQDYLSNTLIPKSQCSKNGINSYKETFFKEYYKRLKETDLKKEERLKIIFILQYFVIYLTYRSNGSPRKMVRLFEEFIKEKPELTNREKDYQIVVNLGRLYLCSKEYDKEKMVKCFKKFIENSWKLKNREYNQELSIKFISEKTQKNSNIGLHFTREMVIEFEEFINENSKEGEGYQIVVTHNSKNEKKLYLSFSYDTQYKLGFIAHLYRPFLLHYSGTLKKYSDTVLVSTPYLMDHLLKFHSFAFSMHNLELIPEILSTYKTPELRYFVEEIVNFLSQNYIRETEISLFEYKFTEKIHNELAYVSKLYEDESAAFNFTLDEDFGIKVHLQNKIKELGSSKSVYFLNDQLGDTYFFNQEFVEARQAYTESIQFIKSENPGEISMEKFIFLIRMKLKIGLTYEKMKHYEMALGHYNDAIEVSKKYFAILGIQKKKRTSKALINNAYNELLQIINQAFLANLFLLEKSSLEGANLSKVIEYSEEFRSIVKKVEDNYIIERKLNIIRANFFSNIAKLLYFRNEPLLFKNNNIQNITKLSLGNEVTEWIEKEGFMPHIDSLFIELLPFVEKVTGEELKDNRIGAASYFYYKLSLQILLDNDPKEESNQNNDLNHLISRSFKVLDNYQNDADKIWLKNIANTIANIGDCLVSQVSQDDFKEIVKIFNLNKISDEVAEYGIIRVLDNHIKDIKDPSFPKSIIILYYLAGRFFLKAGMSSDCSFQFKKILQLIKNIAPNRFEKDEERENFREVLCFLEKTFLAKIIEIASWNSFSTDRSQLFIYKDYLGIDTLNQTLTYSKHTYSALSTAPDSREAILIFASMKIKTYDFKKEFELGLGEWRIPEQSLIDPSNTISFQQVRIMELDLQNSINTSILRNYLFPNEKVDQWEDTEYKIFRNYNIFNQKNYQILKVNSSNYGGLIANSIFCLYQIINIINMYGVNYTISYSYLANFHRKLGVWLKHYSLYKEMSSKDEIKEKMEEMIGKRALVSLDTFSEFQKALQYYHKAIQMHNEGDTYQYHNKNFIFLEDDFNDNFYHFGAALERQLINSNYIRNKIKKLEKELINAPLYKYKSYVNDRYWEK